MDGNGKRVARISTVEKASPFSTGWPSTLRATSGMLFFVTWAENSRRDPRHKLRSFLACKETPKADESRNYSGFDLNNFSRQIPIGYPFIWQSINQMEWRGTTVSISGYFYLSGMRVLERRNEANLGIIFAQASGSSILLVLFYQKRRTLLD